MASDIFNSPYDSGKIDALYKRVKHGKEVGQPQDYEIKVDQQKVVARNSDPALFLSFEEFIQPETRNVVFIMYRGGGTSSDKFFFHLDGQGGQNSLSGFGEQANPNKIRQEVSKTLESQYEIRDLKKQNADLSKEVKELEEEITDLETKIEKLKDGAAYNVETIFGVVAQKLGIGLTNNAPQPNPNLQGTPEQQATFKKKAETEGEEVIPEGESVVVTAEHAGYFKLLCDLKNRFNEEELAILMVILDKLRNNKQALFSTNKHIDTFLKQKPKAENN